VRSSILLERVLLHSRTEERKGETKEGNRENSGPARTTCLSRVLIKGEVKMEGKPGRARLGTKRHFKERRSGREGEEERSIPQVKLDSLASQDNKHKKVDIDIHEFRDSWSQGRD